MSTKKKDLYNFSTNYLGIREIPHTAIEDKYANQKDGSRFMQLDQGKIHYRVQGEGPIILAIHGMADSLHTWSDISPYLSKLYKMISLDLPGFGQSDALKDYSSLNFSQIIHQFVEKLGIQEFILFGHSLGGYIAWNYTLSYPQNVSKLILFNPAAFPTKKIPDALRIAGIPILRSLSLKFTPKYFTKKMANQVFNDKSKVTDEKIDRYHHMLMRAGNRKSYQNIFLEMLSKKDEQPQNLKKISSPTFLVWGEEDFWIPATQIEQWKQAIPHLISVSYPKVGHMPHEEIPKKTAHDVLSFLHGTFQ